MKAFLNRKAAALELAEKLKGRELPNPIVLGIPRGGVPMAALIARQLSCPLDILLIKKIGHPENPEYAIGAVGLESSHIIPHDDVSSAYIENTTFQLRNRLKEMHMKFLKGRHPIDLSNKTVILVDDGIATGNTLMMGINIIQQANPKKIIVAVPVASLSAAEKIRKACDELICLLTPHYFGGVGAFYEDFSEVSDTAVENCLQDFYSNQ